MAHDVQLDTDRRGQLLSDGYCSVPNVLDSKMVAELQDVSDALTAKMDAEERERHRYTGSLISLHDDERFAPLIAWPAAIEAFASLGLTELCWTAGYVISKPTQSPSLFWHQDWWAWDEPESYQQQSVQLFAMYYLVDTTPENGCLRVLPGTHVRRHTLHDQLATAHTDGTYQSKELGPEHSHIADEVDVMVRAGDLVIGDARLLHASHANGSDRPRTVITVWYLPQVEQHSERLQRRIGNLHLFRSHKVYDEWSSEAREKIRHLLPEHDGDRSEPDFQRVPGPQLRP